MHKIADLLKKKCCIFIGAGIPASLGFPAWSKLAENLVNFTWSKREVIGTAVLTYGRIDGLLTDIKKGNLIRVITYCRDRLKEVGQEEEFQKAVVSLLNDKKKYDDIIKNPVYIELQKILKDSITVQTNLDTSLELLVPNIRILNTTLPETVQDISGPTLVYLHGIITQPETWILTIDQYNLFYQTEPSALCRFLQSLFRTHDVLFLGYSCNDKEILDQIARIKAPGRERLLVLPELDSDKHPNAIFESSLKHYGISVERYSIENDGYSEFSRLLKDVNGLMQPPVRPATEEDGSKK